MCRPIYFACAGLSVLSWAIRSQGDPIGSGDVVAFAAMRRQADGTWAMVEPAKRADRAISGQSPLI